MAAAWRPENKSPTRALPMRASIEGSKTPTLTTPSLGLGAGKAAVAGGPGLRCGVATAGGPGLRSKTVAPPLSADCSPLDPPPPAGAPLGSSIGGERRPGSAGGKALGSGGGGGPVGGAAAGEAPVGPPSVSIFNDERWNREGLWGEGAPRGGRGEARGARAAGVQGAASLATAEARRRRSSASREKDASIGGLGRGVAGEAGRGGKRPRMSGF